MIAKAAIRITMLGESPPTTTKKASAFSHGHVAKPLSRDFRNPMGAWRLIGKRYKDDAEPMICPAPSTHEQNVAKYRLACIAFVARLGTGRCGACRVARPPRQRCCAER
jgi:hypothetical protein